MRSFVLTLAVAVSVFLLATPVVADPGDERWRDTLNIADGFGWATGLALEGKRLFAVGSDENASGDLDMIVRAYSTKNGEILWDDVVDEYEMDDAASGVIAKRNRLYVRGSSGAFKNRQDWHIRVYNAKTGQLLWRDIFDTSDHRDIVTDMILAGRLLLAAGRITLDDDTEDVLVRAYNAATGAVAWEDQHDEAGADDQPRSLAIKGRRVVVCGRVTTSNGDWDAYLRAYHRDTGKVLWDVRFGDPSSGEECLKVVVVGRRVLHSVRVLNDGLYESRMQARSLKNGQLAWDVGMDEADDEQTILSSIVVKGGQAYWTAIIGSELSTADWLFGAINVRNGKRSWTERFGTSGQDWSPQLVLQRRTVFVFGTTADDFGERDLRLRAYNARDGAFLWEDVVTGPGDDIMSAVLVKGKALYQASAVENANGDRDFVVRALTTK